MKRIKIIAKTIVAFQNGSHKILENGCLVIEGEKILYVGKNFEGHVDEVLDYKDFIITPGFINVHTHISGSPLDKTLIDDHGDRQFYFSGLADIIPAIISVTDDDARSASVDFSFAELIRTGTTTFMEMGPFGDYIYEKTVDVGLRGYISNWFQGATWIAKDGKYLEYHWNEEKAIREFKDSLRFIEKIDGAGEGRLKGFISPLHTDTSTEKMLRMCRSASDDMKVPLALHVSQSIMEFQEVLKRTKMTPVEWLESINFLSEWNILGHVIFTTGNSWVNFPGHDLEILGAHNVSVAHCPWVFGKRGITLESFSKYQEAGINMCLGTDTVPQSMIESIRLATIIGKMMSRHIKYPQAHETFNAATINPAKMLHRDDLGRIAPGALADLLFWDSKSLFMVPNRDPIKAIVYYATPLDLKNVMVNGKWIMENGKLQTLDEQAVCDRMQMTADRVWGSLGNGNSELNMRSILDYSPLSYPSFEG